MKDVQTEAVWDDRARLLRVMAHPMRLKILSALCRRPRCVKDINSLVSIVQPHLSQHMALLRKAGLVDCHVCGSLRCYYIVRPTLVKSILRLLSEKHPLRLQDRRAVVRAAGGRENMGTPAKVGRKGSKRRILAAGGMARR